ncbi:unnamed protein product [Brassica oleracea]|uniref:Uncharacterized protein n=1 Tax=Brassica oleracea TaxID=3712 RepID=A0A3P6E180_BRAOL|nr:unnamed protein product [Brassica oleracea]
MLRLIKRVDKKVGQLDEILLPLEAFVKDVEKQKQRKKCKNYKIKESKHNLNKESFNIT